GVRPAVRLRELADEYAALLRSAFGDRLVAVALLGPVRGDAHTGFDMHVLVVVGPISPGPFSRKDLVAAADDAMAPLLAAPAMDGIPVRLRRIVRTPADVEAMVPLQLDLCEDGVPLFDRGGFLAGLLRDVRDAVDRLGARRVTDASGAYWEMPSPDET